MGWKCDGGEMHTAFRAYSAKSMLCVPRVLYSLARCEHTTHDCVGCVLHRSLVLLVSACLSRYSRQRSRAQQANSRLCQSARPSLLG